MRTRIGLVVGLLAVAGCSSPSETSGTTDVPRVSTGQLAPRIVGGTPSPSAQDAVVLIEVQNGYCSGTLIAPNLVLTARHCVVAQMDESTECGTFYGDAQPSSFTVSVGANQNPMYPTASARGVKVIDDGQSNGCSHDIALIQLDHDIANAPVAPVRATPVTTAETVTAVGYGDDGSGTPTNGRYQRGGLSVLAVGPANATYSAYGGDNVPFQVPAGEIATGESTCYGDSGGPILDAQGAVVGVTSRGVGSTCYSLPSIYSDVVSHYTMISQAAAAAGHPLAATGVLDAGVADASAWDAAAATDASHGAPPSGNGGNGGLGGGDNGDNGPPDLSPGVPAVDAGSGTKRSAGASGGSSGGSSGGCAMARGQGPEPIWMVGLAALLLSRALRRRHG